MATPVPPRRPSRLPWVVLGVMAASYAVVSFVLSDLRLIEMYPSNWDLGIFQQMLFATLHGHPLYEAGDWESFGTVSFLEIHPAFTTLGLVPFYALDPSPASLFAVQSAVGAATSFPLYGIGRRVIGRPWPAVGLAGLYLLSAPLLSANLFDVHLELFLPFELVLLFYCWIGARYRWGLLVAVITWGTLEVAPFLVGFMALYFLVPPLRPLGAKLLAWGRPPTARQRSPRPTERSPWAARLRDWLAPPVHRWSLALLLLSAAAYPLLRALQWYVLPGVLPPAPNPPALPLFSAGAATGFGLDATGTLTFALAYKLGFWATLLLCFGLLPLAAPKLLILEVPWFLFTLQSDRLIWTTLGLQYAAIPLAPLAIASIYGYRNLRGPVSEWLTRPPVPPPGLRRFLERPRFRLAGWSRTRRRRVGMMIAGAFVVGVVAVNAALSPANPYRQRTDSAAPGYNVQWVPAPGYERVATLVRLIPSDGLVLASSNLFPFVANDLNAYSLLWFSSTSPLQYPFGPGGKLPAYLLLSENQLSAVPPWLLYDLAHREFGLRAEATGTPVQTVYLWEPGFRGNTTYIG